MHFLSTLIIKKIITSIKYLLNLLLKLTIFALLIDNKKNKANITEPIGIPLKPTDDALMVKLSRSI